MIYSKVFLKSDKECLSKPEIRFGNYFFKWDENAKYGLAVDEINDFRNFVKKVIPFLEQYMMLLQDESKSSQSNNSYHEKKKLFLEGKHNSFISFLLFVDIEGKTTFYRQERCELISDEEFKEEDDDILPSVVKQITTNVGQTSRQNKYCSVHVKWSLGELLFDRTKI